MITVRSFGTHCLVEWHDSNLETVSAGFSAVLGFAGAKISALTFKISLLLGLLQLPASEIRPLPACEWDVATRHG